MFDYWHVAFALLLYDDDGVDGVFDDVIDGNGASHRMMITHCI